MVPTLKSMKANTPQLPCFAVVNILLESEQAWYCYIRSKYLVHKKANSILEHICCNFFHHAILFWEFVIKSVKYIDFFYRTLRFERFPHKIVIPQFIPQYVPNIFKKERGGPYSYFCCNKKQCWNFRTIYAWEL